MRLTNGAITNLIANYKAVLGRMFVNNKASCKKRAAALLACLIMAAAAPVMGETYTIGDGGGEYPTLVELIKHIESNPPLADTHTVIFKKNDSSLGTQGVDWFIVNADTTLTLVGDNKTISPNSGNNPCIELQAGSTITLTLAAENGATITVTGFENNTSHGGAIAGGTEGIVFIGKENGGTLKFIENETTRSGGAIRAGEVEIKGGINIFEDNTAGSLGGAIYGSKFTGSGETGAKVTISGGTNTFTNNEALAHVGGAIAIYNGDVLISGGTNTFTGNKALDLANDNANGNGGAIGGAGSVPGASTTVTVSGGTNTFDSNLAGQNGGAISADTVTIDGGTKNKFKDNESGYGRDEGGSGGAIIGTTVIIEGGTNNVFDTNKAGENGGAISGDTVTIDGGDKNEFINNIAGNNDGGGSGGAISGIDITISGGDNTFQGNTAYGSSATENGIGGAISGETSVTIDGGTNAFISNIAHEDGGAISGLTVTIDGDDTTTNDFTGNKAYANGGAIRGETVIITGTGTIANSFTKNVATKSGGAISGNEVTIESGVNTFGDENDITAGNTAGEVGGAIHGSTIVTIDGGENYFYYNNAGEDGGAISGSTVSLEDDSINTFIGNKTVNGNGGAIHGEIVELDGDSINTFIGNIANTTEEPGVETPGNGGAIFGDTVTISGTAPTEPEDYNNFFLQNRAAGSGGAIAGGVIAIESGVNIFGGDGEGNIAGDSGGAIFGSTSVDITGGENWFTGNKAESGGAIASGGDVTIEGADTVVYFIDNRATLDGGAIAAVGDVTFTDSAEVYFDSNISKHAETSALIAENLILEEGATLIGNGGFLARDSISFTDSTVDLDGKIKLSLGEEATGDIEFTGMTLKGQGELASSEAITLIDGDGSPTPEWGLTADVEDEKFITISAQLTGDGALVKEGLGTLVITGNNSDYIGDTALDAGSIYVGHENALGIDGELTMAADTTLGFAANNLILNNGIILDGDATIDTNGYNATLAGEVTNGGNTLTKENGGTLILANTDNVYSGSTLNIDGGILAITVANDDPPASPGEVSIDTVNNNARLNFVGVEGVFYQKAITIDTYSGEGVIGLQASLADTAWSDHVTFTADPEHATVGFTFETGSTIKNMPAEGLPFATIAGDDDSIISLDSASSTLGAYKLGVVYDDSTYSLVANFDRAGSKAYSEAAAAGLGQAAWMHGRTLFNATNEAARDASANNTTGIFAGYERVDSRFDTGSHADVKGNNFTVALGFKANEKTTWGLFGQMFKGDYDTSTGNAINSSGDLDAHDFGLFVEYRPAGQTETGAGHYYKGIVRAGRTTSDFRANNGLNGGYSTFSMGRNVFGMSFGGGYVKAMEQDKSADFYTHLIYTGLNGNTVTDSLQQEINFGSSNSFRLLTGARLNFNQTKRTTSYFGAALDYEFSGTTDAYIDGFKAEKADLKGLTGILELGLVTKPNATTAINIGLQGYVGKKQGLGGTLSISKLF